MSQVPATVVFGLHSIGCSESGRELQTHPAEASDEEARVYSACAATFRRDAAEEWSSGQPDLMIG